MPFLSVIIPTYNCEKTVGNCLRSLVNQTFQDFEILIIDGLSTDNTLCLVKSFLEQNPGLDYKFISEKDNGIFHAMNKGAALASGKWLYFLGSDDCLHSNDIFAQVKQGLSKSDSTDFFYGNALIEETKAIYDGKFGLRHLLKSNICHQAIFIKKTLFEELGPFDLRFQVHADWDFNLKVFLAGKERQFSDLLIVRYSNQGFSSGKRDIPFEEKIRLIKADYFQHFRNRVSSRIHHLKKRILKFILL
ncbi:glycosyltransferase family 2 protein [Flavitalea antarctica]